MLRRLGYVAISLSIGATTNRTCRLGNATPGRLRELTAANLSGLAATLAFNVRQSVSLYRISSKIVPFASLPAVAFPWWEEFAVELSQLGELVRRHELRVSMHPGQYTALSAPDEATRAASVQDLAWHVRFLDSLGLDATHKIVTHLGGIYGDKGAALRRFAGVVAGLPESWRRRLAVENDDRLYTFDDVLWVAAETGLPAVFDWLHHRLNPGRRGDVASALADAFATWQEGRDGVPKVHFSSQQQGGRAGAHADWIEVDEFLKFLSLVPATPFDCMLEAKKKDLALFRLRRELAASGRKAESVA